MKRTFQHLDGSETFCAVDLDRYRTITTSISAHSINRALTLGLKRVYQGIQEKKSTKEDIFSTNQEGFLVWDESLEEVIMSRRYKIEGIVGMGSLCEVYIASDLFRENRHVAIKVIRKGFEPMGYREMKIIWHLKRRNSQGIFHLTECLDSFITNDQLCLVLPLYAGTLAQFIDFEVNTINTNKTAIIPKELNSNNISSNRNTSTNNSTTIRKIINDEHFYTIQKIAISLLSAVSTLHQEGIIHGDIKPENCFVNMNTPQKVDLNTIFFSNQMFNSNSSLTKYLELHNSSHNQRDYEYSGRNNHFFDMVKLGDFSNSFLLKDIWKSNLSTQSNEHTSTRSWNIQSLPYRAPEVLVGLSEISTKIDIWSIGILLLELFLQETVFAVQTKEEAIKMISLRFHEFPSYRYRNTPSSSSSLSSSSSSSSSLSISIFTSSPMNTSKEDSNLLSKIQKESDKYRNLLAQSIRRLILSSLDRNEMTLRTNYNSQETTTLSQPPSSNRYPHSHSIRQEESTSISIHHVNLIVDFLSHLLMIDPDQRYSAEEAFTHPFLMKILPFPFQNKRNTDVGNRQPRSIIQQLKDFQYDQIHSAFHVNRYLLAQHYQHSHHHQQQQLLHSNKKSKWSSSSENNINKNYQQSGFDKEIPFSSPATIKSTPIKPESSNHENNNSSSNNSVNTSIETVLTNSSQRMW